MTNSEPRRVVGGDEQNVRKLHLTVAIENEAAHLEEVPPHLTDDDLVFIEPATGDLYQAEVWVEAARISPTDTQGR